MSEMKTTALLSPCPFCGSATRPHITEFEGEPRVRGFVVMCDASGFHTDPNRGCGSSTGWAATPKRAAAAWKRRSPAAALSKAEAK